MKIERKKSYTCTFADVLIGETFIDFSEGDICFKVADCEDRPNAFDIEKPLLFHMQSACLVRKCNATLVVED